MRRPGEAVPAAMRRPGGSSARSREAAGRKQRPQPGGRAEAVPAASGLPGNSARSQAAGREQHMRSISRAEQRRQPGGRAETAPAAKPAVLAPKRKCSSGGLGRRVDVAGGPLWHVPIALVCGSEEGGGRPYPQRVGPRPQSGRWSGFKTARQSVVGGWGAGPVCAVPGGVARGQRYQAKTQVEDVTVPCQGRKRAPCVRSGAGGPRARVAPRPSWRAGRALWAGWQNGPAGWVGESG
jgi:hypothetical protein